MTPSFPTSTASFNFGPRNAPYQANRAIAERGARPNYLITFGSEVDLSEVERAGGRPEGPPEPWHAASVAKALALALRDFPRANGRFCRGGWPFSRRRVRPFRGRDVAVSVGRDAPESGGSAALAIVRDADAATLGAIDRALRERAARQDAPRPWRDRLLGLEEKWPNAWSRWIAAPRLVLPPRTPRTPRAWARHRGGAALVVPPARPGGEAATDTWSYSIRAAFGPVEARPAADGPADATRPSFALTIDFDRRVTSAAEAARFLGRVVEILEHAGSEMAESREADALPTGPDRRQARRRT